MIVAPVSCANFTISIYFEPYSAAITHEAGQLIDAAAQQTRGCDVTGVHVVGLADTPGSADANLKLSQRRAEAVTRAFHKRGLTTVEFQMTAAGDAEAESHPGQAGPLRRRAQATFHLAPKPPPAPPR
jgi:outer membrane protein OmpA-like peptidoglycan-associated protein